MNVVENGAAIVAETVVLVVIAEIVEENGVENVEEIVVPGHLALSNRLRAPSMSSSLFQTPARLRLKATET